MPQPLLHDKLNAETAKMTWSELQPHFARGATVYIDTSLDLIATAQLMAEDNTHAISQLMQQQLIGVVSETQAQEFWDNNQEMWTLVVAPWVLVQPCEQQNNAPINH